jgi:tRNA pseudouridine55 synthase
MNPGLYLVHKPVGVTSFSFVQKAIDDLRAARPNHRPRVVHGGTLDPFAEGLLILLVGPATRLFEYLHAVPKVYEATVRWGVETDNGDPLGKVTFEGDPSDLTAERLETARGAFVGWHEQVPPATSNKRVGGERAYVRAHRGEAVELPPSRVYLHEAQWVSHALPGESRLRVVVRGGYYVRALVRDLGRALGCGAHLAGLRRVSIGPYVDPAGEEWVERHGRDVLPWAPVRVLSDFEVGELRHGRPIPLGAVTPPDWSVPAGFPDPAAPIRGFHLGKLVCLLQAEGQSLKTLAELRGGV